VAVEAAEITACRLLVVENDVLLGDNLVDDLLVHGFDRWIVEASGSPGLCGDRDNFRQPFNQPGSLPIRPSRPCLAILHLGCYYKPRQRFAQSRFAHVEWGTTWGEEMQHPSYKIGGWEFGIGAAPPVDGLDQQSVG